MVEDNINTAWFKIPESVLESLIFFRMICFYMSKLSQYRETVQNLNEASSEETFELLFVFSGLMIIIVVTPAIYFTTNNLMVSGLSVAFGFLDFVASQVIPKRIEGDKSDENEH